MRGHRCAAGTLMFVVVITIILDACVVAQVKGGWVEQALGHFMFLPNVHTQTSWKLNP